MYRRPGTVRWRGSGRPAPQPSEIHPSGEKAWGEGSEGGGEEKEERDGAGEGEAGKECEEEGGGAHADAAGSPATAILPDATHDKSMSGHASSPSRTGGSLPGDWGGPPGIVARSGFESRDLAVRILGVRRGPGVPART